MSNRVLTRAKQEKKDEFYTQLGDIENELKHYKKYFKDKVIFCNCDDPYESNFFKYFAINFNHLGLKKLIATSYAGSPISGREISLFDDFDHPPPEKIGYKVEINEVRDFNEDGATDLLDVEYLLKNEKNTSEILKEGGCFLSDECIELLKAADIIVTNPPFSRFREYVAKLVEYDKKFIIIGNTNALTYKEIFPLIKENKFFTGFTNFNRGMYFVVPDDWEKYHHIDKNQNKIVRVSTSCWYTNLEIRKYKEPITLYKKYTPEEYPKYDNYDAIEVSKVAEIPYDYDGVMGVPITFLDKYNPEQFEILGLSQKVGLGLESKKNYNDYYEIHQSGEKTGSSGKKVNGNPVMSGKPEKGNYYYNGKCYAYSLYARIFIKRKEQLCKSNSTKSPLN